MRQWLSSTVKMVWIFIFSRHSSSELTLLVVDGTCTQQHNKRLCSNGPSSAYISLCELGHLTWWLSARACQTEGRRALRQEH